MNDFDKLEAAARKLVKVLEDKQPGLYTWNCAYSSACLDLWKILNELKGD